MSLITADGQIDRAAVAARAVELAQRITRVPVLELATCTVYEEHATSIEAATVAACKQAELELAMWQAAQERVRAFDDWAAALAAHHGYDVETIRAERDWIFWGSAWNRRDLVQGYNAALVIARARQGRAA